MLCSKYKDDKRVSILPSSARRSLQRAMNWLCCDSQPSRVWSCLVAWPVCFTPSWPASSPWVPRNGRRKSTALITPTSICLLFSEYSKCFPSFVASVKQSRCSTFAVLFSLFASLKANSFFFSRAISKWGRRTHSCRRNRMTRSTKIKQSMVVMERSIETKRETRSGVGHASVCTCRQWPLLMQS